MILFIILVATTAIQIIWYLISFFALKAIKEQDAMTKNMGISLIIAARNEDENLLKNIPIWLQQKHENFEIVIVDDRSVDDTFDTIEALMQTDHRIKRTAVVEYKNSSIKFGKKYSLTLGIKLAQHEHLIFTDADCIPSDPYVLQRFTKAFANGNDLILGVGAFHKKPGIINSIVRTDNQRIAALYLSFAKLGLPYMGVGRAMAYTKSLFYSLKGFASHQHIESGDDDLFVLEAVKAKAKVGLVPRAATLSDAAASLKAWKNQKTRHLSTGIVYPFHILLLLSLLDFSAVISLIFLPLVMAFSHSYSLIIISLSLFLLRMIGFVLVSYQLAKRTKLSYDGFHNFLAEPLLSCLNAVFSSLALVTKKSGWKTKI
jgi:glycosyltransferase involved in cell wall biosynthesis